MLVVCKLLIVFNMGGILIQDLENVEGKVLETNKISYLVDFSEAAKESDYVGDYSKVLIPKDQCIEEK